MIPRIACAIFTGLSLAAAGALAACPHADAPLHPPKNAKQRQHAESCVDLGAVPQISAHIAASGPLGPAAKPSTYNPPAATKYEGPTVGLTKPEPGVRPAPTVGYKWSLD